MLLQSLRLDDCSLLKFLPNFEQHIGEFKDNCELLGVSVTPKVHKLVNHVAQFCSKYQTGLEFFGEQAATVSNCIKKYFELYIAVIVVILRVLTIYNLIADFVYKMKFIITLPVRNYKLYILWIIILLK